MPTIVWYVLIFIIASVWVAFFHSFHSSQCAILVINRRFLRLIFDWVRNWMILYIEKSQATHFFSSSIQFFSYIFFFVIFVESLFASSMMQTHKQWTIYSCAAFRNESLSYLLLLLLNSIFFPGYGWKLAFLQCTLYTIMNDNFWMMFSTFDKAIFRQHTQICLPLSIFGTIYTWFLARLCYSQRCEWGSFFRCMATTIRNI